MTRGASTNPPNRFERIHLEPAFEEDLEQERIEAEQLRQKAPQPATHYLKDHARSILTFNDSPDIPFSASINPYRGCEHGCIYCYARPNHEYVGYSAGLDFETRILVKHDAPELLRKELLKPGWKPQLIALSGVTDCYQPVEKRLKLTRRCLEVLTEFRNPFGIVTKSYLVTRDLDLLTEMAAHRAAAVNLTLTTLDANLAGKLEPRAARPSLRLEAIRKLSEAGVPTGVMVSPVIPGLTDHEIPAILEAAADAGARWAAYVPLRLPHAVSGLFEGWLEQHYPDRKERVLSLVRGIRDGKLNEPDFGKRMRGTGPWADHLNRMFGVFARKHGLNRAKLELSTESFRRPGEQMRLF